LKVLVAGNLVNWGYHFVKVLRENGIDAELLMPRYPKKSDDPKTFEKLEEYPAWIKFWNNKKWTWKFEVISTMRKYDLIHAITELPIFAMISGKPYVAFPTGSDINELVFQKNLRGILLNWAYKRAKKIVLSGPVLIESANKLKLKNTVCIPSPWAHHSVKIENENLKKFTIFYPTRHDWKIKGNDKFLYAFSEVCKGVDDIKLIIIKHGVDIDKSLKILKQKQCHNKVEIINQTLEHKSLISYYNKADIVVNSFPKTDSLGLIGLEALSFGKPLLSHIKPEIYKIFYDEIPPIINCESKDEIYFKLKELIFNQEKCKKIGASSQKWFERNYNTQNIVYKFKLLYESILSGKSDHDLK
jgi:glycosyltransferase involved in cell wall biosynthesis